MARRIHRAGHGRWRLDRVRASLITLVLAATALLPLAVADLGAAEGERPPGSKGRARQAREPSPIDVEQLAVQVVAIYPHDPTAFTQGLVWKDGLLYESTGLYGRSTVRRVEPSSGRILAKKLVDPNYFAEGLALSGDRLIQLTWKAGVALVYDRASLELVDQWGYNGEGWGLAGDGKRVVMSNGSSLLTFRHPVDFRWLSSLEVTLDGRPQSRLNELEFAEGELYANVWGENRIVRIDDATGQVSAEIDASGLLTPREAALVDVLNGIAYDPDSQTFWLTGKFWPKIFQVVFVPR